MIRTDADVIITGAGPAGAMAAFELARNGIKPLVLEKTTFPRFKVCGGGLTHKILREIPFDISTVIESSIYNIRFSSGFQHVFSKSSPEPIMYCTMREKLDNLLIRKAQETGAIIHFGKQVKEISEDQGGLVVRTATQNYRCRLLIGADGPISIVARSAGLRNDIGQGLAWEAEITTDPDSLAAYSKTVFLDWGTFPGGYGWAFPKKDHFSVGVGGPARLAKWMIPYYDRFMTSNRMTIMETRSFLSHPIQVRIRKGQFHKGNILVAGDAAGLTDALTGEGIYYAVCSGKMAAEACYTLLSGKSNSLISYTEKVNEILMPELLEGSRIGYIFNAVPLRIHFFVRDNNRGWRAFRKVLRGERSYLDVKSGFGKWRFLWNAACYVAKIIGKRKTMRFLRSGFNR